MKIIKRNGSEVDFDIAKIIVAITKANEAVDEDVRMTPMQIQRISESVVLYCENMQDADGGRKNPTVEEVQDLVEHQIMAHGAFEVAKAYITYRYKRNLVRESNTTDERILTLLERSEEGETEGKKKPILNATQRDYIAGEVSEDITRRILLPEEIVKAHEDGVLEVHDTLYFAQHMHDSEWVNLEDMLEHGTVIDDTMIEKPHSFATACSIATEIMAHVSSNQCGRQTISLEHLVPFVAISRRSLNADVLKELKENELFAGLDEEKLAKAAEEIAEKRLSREIQRGVQTIQYQGVTLLTSSGRAPSVSIVIYEREAKNEEERRDFDLVAGELLRQRLEGVKNERGEYFVPASPRLIYVLQNDNLSSDLTRLSCELAMKGVLSYISERWMREYLTDDAGLKPFYGCFNEGTVTLNLVDLALSFGKLTLGNEKQFDELLEERLKLCHQALLCRHARLKNTLSDSAPILWQKGAIARLKKGQTVDSVMNERAIISLGVCGLDDAVEILTDKNLTKPQAVQAARRLIDRLDAACDRWAEEDGLNYHLCAISEEKVLKRFARTLHKRFGSGFTKDAVSAGYRLAHPEEYKIREILRAEGAFARKMAAGTGSRLHISQIENAEEMFGLIRVIYDESLLTEFTF